MRPAADGEISEGDTPQALREAHEREVQAMREAHEKEVGHWPLPRAAARRHCARAVTLDAAAQRVELQAKASRAQEEWHRIESDLYHVKSAHLEALQELRSVREAQVQTERELTERVAELSDELRERTEELDLTVDALEEKEKECAAKEAALQNTTQEADVSAPLGEREGRNGHTPIRPQAGAAVTSCPSPFAAPRLCQGRARKKAAGQGLRVPGNRPADGKGARAFAV